MSYVASFHGGGYEPTLLLTREGQELTVLTYKTWKMRVYPQEHQGLL